MDRSRPEGPDYLIIDNFVDIFSDFEMADLINTRNEVQALTEQFCISEEDQKHARCDNLVWIQNLIDNGEATPALKQIAFSMASFRETLNESSQSEQGDKTLRVDAQEEIMISKFNGASPRDQEYQRHKDSYVRDKNNEIHGSELRKLSMVIFLNDNLDEVY